jgi:DNA mismatch endonuclease (patch repair protein)
MRHSGKVKAPSFSGFSPASDTASRVKSRTGKRDTKPELLLRAHLWRKGLRYRLHFSGLQGRPDIVFPATRVAVFCDGDFWHGRNWRSRRERLSRGTNPDYWIPKIETNMERDRRNTAALTDADWHVIRLWEADINANPEQVASLVASVVETRLRLRNRQRS